MKKRRGVSKRVRRAGLVRHPAGGGETAVVFRKYNPFRENISGNVEKGSVLGKLEPGCCKKGGGGGRKAGISA